MKKPRDYIRVFDKVMMLYEDIRTLSTTNSCGGFYRGLGGNAGGKIYSRAVTPVLSDFICDVELAGRAVLTPADFRFFKEGYLDQSLSLHSLITTDPKYKRIHINIVQTVGRELVRRRVHPVRVYFKSKVVFAK